ncbi:MAG: hypothetical protein LGR52_08525, partial [Candidatus Thiosymbion ectosymbiont of Robbea hypermnestra]|nr:hypothetical protein [Candidatus Thiosymbion ectosymbiont of Robbea hypermnestra]
ITQRHQATKRDKGKGKRPWSLESAMKISRTISDGREEFFVSLWLCVRKNVEHHAGFTHYPNFVVISTDTPKNHRREPWIHTKADTNSLPAPKAPRLFIGENLRNLRNLRIQASQITKLQHYH